MKYLRYYFQIEKRKTLSLVLIILFSSCLLQRENVYLTTGKDYGYDPAKWTIGCQYDSLDYSVMDKIIEKFGDHYQFTKTINEDQYEWKNLTCKDISKNPIDVLLIRRTDMLRFKDQRMHELEDITFYISKNGRDLLKPLRFRKRYLVKRFLSDLTK